MCNNHLTLFSYGFFAGKHPTLQTPKWYLISFLRIAFQVSDIPNKLKIWQPCCPWL